MIPGSVSLSQSHTHSRADFDVSPSLPASPGQAAGAAAPPGQGPWVGGGHGEGAARAGGRGGKQLAGLSQLAAKIPGRFFRVTPKISNPKKMGCCSSGTVQ